MEIDLAQNHFLPLFVGDFLASTATWSGPERGLYVQLLMLQWCTKALPSDPDRLARVAHYSAEEFRQLWPVMADKFEVAGSTMANIRLEQHRERSAEIQSARSQAGKHGAAARWQNDSKGNGKGNSDAIGFANGKPHGKKMPSDPIQSYLDPIQSGDAREAEAHKSAHVEPQEVSRQTTDEGEPFDTNWLSANWPETANNRNTIAAIHCATALVNLGYSTWPKLRANVAALRAFHAAKADPAVVPGMAKYFRHDDPERYWERDWPKPKSRAQKDQDSNIAASLEWLERSQSAGQ